MEDESFSIKAMQLIVKHLDAQGSDREVARKTKLSNTLIGNFKSGASMRLDTLDKILEAYPELRRPIAYLLLGESDENSTAAIKEIELRLEVESLKKKAAALARLNLVNAQTIAKLSGVEVVEKS